MINEQIMNDRCFWEIKEKRRAEPLYSGKLFLYNKTAAEIAAERKRGACFKQAESKLYCFDP